MKRHKIPRQIRLGNGLPPIEVVDDATAETADYVICMPNGQGEYFADDIRTLCFWCGRGIHHRPHAPMNPKKVCIYCATKLADASKYPAN